MASAMLAFGMAESESLTDVEWDKPEPSPFWDPDIQAIFAYWRSIAPPGKLPGPQHLHPVAIAELLPGIWILDVQREPFRLRYREVGARVVHGIGRDVTGRWLDEAHPDIGTQPAYLERYRRVVETGIPSWRRGPPRLSIRLDFNVIENIVLPFATDGETVDMLLVLTAFHSGQPSEE
jgi:hypothetical protein